MWAALQALRQHAPPIVVSDGHTALTSELVLLGNGHLYAGQYRLFPQASACDGLLDATVFPKIGWRTLLRCGPRLLLYERLPGGVTHSLRAAQFTLTSEGRTPFELDGELVGHLPATFGVRPGALRVIVP